MTEVKGYPNYLIYENGKVWSKNYNRYLKCSERQGYMRISLNKNNITKRFSLHRILAEHYIPNPNNYKEIDHIDRNRSNNNLNNLRWADRKIQMNNTILISNTGEKNIYLTTMKKGKYSYTYYKIQTHKFTKLLNIKNWSLEEAVEIRDAYFRKQN